MQYVFIHFEKTFEAMQCQMCGKYLRITENHGTFVKTKKKNLYFYSSQETLRLSALFRLVNSLIRGKLNAQRFSVRTLDNSEDDMESS